MNLTICPLLPSHDQRGKQAKAQGHTKEEMEVIRQKRADEQKEREAAVDKYAMKRAPPQKAPVASAQAPVEREVAVEPQQVPVSSPPAPEEEKADVEEEKADAPARFYPRHLTSLCFPSSPALFTLLLLCSATPLF
jgi:hypothetical protein